MRWRDLGYAGFLCSGLVLLGAVALNWLPTDSWLYLGLARVYELPILFLFAGGGLLGIGFAIARWSESALSILAVLTIAAPAIPWLYRSWPEIWGIGAPVFLLSYTFLAVGLPLRWYLRDRRRLHKRFVAQPDRSWIE
jgi:hypothetical protein